ncbi:MAG: hypothetical protein V3R99_06830 [Thermoguttaceae bacterium]
MALQKREKILTIVTGSLLVVFLIVTLLSGGGGSMSTLRAKRKSLSEDVQTKKDTIRSGRGAVEQMTAWQKHSLPSGYEHARSLYQDWIRALVDKASFRDVKVDSSGGQSGGGSYRMLTFTIHGDATIDQLTRFLFDFYSVGHLHKIRHLSIKPIKDSKHLTLSIIIEALSMPQADRPDTLSKEPSERLELAELEDYVEAIVKRQLDEEQDPVDGGLFVAYRPPAPPYEPPPPTPDPLKPPEFDPTTQTFLTAVVGVGGRPQAWLFIRSSNKTLKYYEGDEFEIGPIRGTVARIDVRQVELQVRGRSVLLALNDNLNESLPDDLPEEEDGEVDDPDASEDVSEDSPEAEMSEEQLDELLDELAEEGIDEPTEDPADEPTEDPTDEPTEDPADEPADDPADDEPGAESVDQREALLKRFLEDGAGDAPSDGSDPE